MYLNHRNRRGYLPALLFYLGCSLFSLPYRCFAQQGAIATGGEVTGTNGHVSYSVGQVDYLYLSAPSGTMNAGLQQPYEFFTLSAPAAPLSSLDAIYVYPNPSTGRMALQLDTLFTRDLSYRLFTMDNTYVASGTIAFPITNIDLSHHPAGVYMLLVGTPKQVYQSFRIIKR